MSKMNRLGVGLIVKNEEKDLPRALRSILECADTVWIVDTGSNDQTEHVARDILFRAAKPHAYVTYLEASEKIDGEWLLQNFSQARNQFVDALDTICEWILWLDADDVVLHPERVRKLISVTDCDLIGFEILSGQSVFTHHRLWRTGKGIRFEGACHEYPAWSQETKVMNTALQIRHHLEQNPLQEKSETRNLRILEKEYEKGDRSSRTLFYLANSYRDAGRFQEAITFYSAYLVSGSTFHDQNILAQMYLARCHRFLRQYPQAFSQGFTALSMDQRFSEVWMELAYSFNDCGDFIRASAMAASAMRDYPETTVFVEKDKYHSEPLRMSKILDELARTQLVQLLDT